MKLHSRHFLILLLFIILTFSGCASTRTEPISVTSVKFNTVVTITIYDSHDQQLLEDCLALCDRYEQLFSRTLETSELYQLNHGHVPGEAFPISDELCELLTAGLSYTEKTDGAFSIALAPLTSLWDFSSGNGKVPDDADISNALPYLSYENILLENNAVTFYYNNNSDSPTNMVSSHSNNTALTDSAGTTSGLRMGIDLGAIAKGYVADRLKEYLLSQGVKSAMINLGGNVLCIGSKPDGSDFTIGIQSPFSGSSEPIAAIKISDKSVVSSGTYERCFTENGILYHHLLNPATGYPYDNGLVSVTIISGHSVDGDALSTSCFALGLEEGLAFLDKIPDADGFFVTKDGEIHYTDTFTEKYTINFYK